jgi:hypothetical protein
MFERKPLGSKSKISTINKVLLTVHLLEVRDLVEVADVDDGKVLDTISDTLEKLAQARR